MGILNENLDLKKLDNDYFVVYEPRNTAHHQLMVWKDGELPRLGGELTISEAYQIAKEKGWALSACDTYYKDSYLICENLNRKLGLLSQEMDVCFVVSREEGKELDITDDMDSHQKYIRSQVNRLNGYDKTPQPAWAEKFGTFEDFKRIKEQFYSRLK